LESNTNLNNIQFYIIAKPNNLLSKLIYQLLFNLNYKAAITNFKKLKGLNLFNNNNYIFILFDNSPKTINSLNSFLLTNKIYDSACLLMILSKNFGSDSWETISELLIPTQLITEPVPNWLLMEKIQYLENFLLLKNTLLSEKPDKRTNSALTKEKKILYDELFCSLNHEFRNALTPIFLSSLIINKYYFEDDIKIKNEINSFLKATKDFSNLIKDLDVILKKALIDV